MNFISENKTSFQFEQQRELLRARELHPAPIQSAHEAVGILAEGFIDLLNLARAKKLDRAKTLKELVQIAAMAQRAAEDLRLI